MSFCPFANGECRNDCVFNDEDCKILRACEGIKDIQKQTTDCSYTYGIYSKLDEIIEELQK